MLTPATAAVFASHIANVSGREGRSQEFIAQSVVRQRDLHAEYEALFAMVLDQARAVLPWRRESVIRCLRRLGDVGCRSGTMNFIDMVEWLNHLGISRANWIMEHDRRFIADCLEEHMMATGNAAVVADPGRDAEVG